MFSRSSLLCWFYSIEVLNLLWFTHFFGGKIWFERFSPCKEFDILQLCLLHYNLLSFCRTLEQVETGTCLQHLDKRLEKYFIYKTLKCGEHFIFCKTWVNLRFYVGHLYANLAIFKSKEYFLPKCQPDTTICLALGINVSQWYMSGQK